MSGWCWPQQQMQRTRVSCLPSGCMKKDHAAILSLLEEDLGAWGHMLVQSQAREIGCNYINPNLTTARCSDSNTFHYLIALLIVLLQSLLPLQEISVYVTGNNKSPWY